jgi:hypothetical protein
MPVDGAVIGPTFASQSHFKLFSSWDVENIILPFSHNLEFMFLGYFSFVLWAYI